VIVITRVAEEPGRQLIHATPKLKYPFDRDGRFRFPLALAGGLLRGHSETCSNGS
jgi:hypothetical protein